MEKTWINIDEKKEIKEYLFDMEEEAEMCCSTSMEPEYVIDKIDRIREILKIDK